MRLRDGLVVLAAAGLVLAALPWLLSDFLLALVLSCLMYAGLAVSWAMFSGATNYLSLATAAFFGLGAYVTAWAAGALPYGLAVLAGGLVAAGFAALIGAAVLHLRGAYFAVITFGLGEPANRCDQSAADGSTKSTQQLLERLSPFNARKHLAQPRQGRRDVLQEFGALVQVAQLSIGSKSLHQSLHRT